MKFENIFKGLSPQENKDIRVLKLPRQPRGIVWRQPKVDQMR